MNPGEISHAEQGRQSLLQYLAAAEMALHGGLQIHGFGPVAPAHMERAMAHIRSPYRHQGNQSRAQRGAIGGGTPPIGASHGGCET